MGRKSQQDPKSIENLKHDQESRVNIPTSELQSLMTDEMKEGEDFLYDYALHSQEASERNGEADPQLWWRGKDDTNKRGLKVRVQPIYINEKIQPRAVVENIRALAREGMPMQLELFGDFNGISFEDMVEFYEHQQHWTNRLILGDSLAVMASLSERERLRGQVQMIYFDPPYGIKFASNWQPSTVKRDVKDGKDVTYEPEQIKAFRDTWEEGVNSYLGYIRDRLVMARELLKDSGSIFVQIGDENVHLVRAVMDEVFGKENFVSIITVKKSGTTPSLQIANVNDFILWYSKSKTPKFRRLGLPPI